MGLSTAETLFGVSVAVYSMGLLAIHHSNMASMVPGSRSPTPTFEEMVASMGTAAAASGESVATDRDGSCGLAAGAAASFKGDPMIGNVGAEAARERDGGSTTPELRELLAEPPPIGPRGPLPPLPAPRPVPAAGAAAASSAAADGAAASGEATTADACGEFVSGVRNFTSAASGESAQAAAAAHRFDAPGGSGGGYANLVEAMTAVLQQQLELVQKAMALEESAPGHEPPQSPQPLYAHSEALVSHIYSVLSSPPVRCAPGALCHQPPAHSGVERCLVCRGYSGRFTAELFGDGNVF